MEKKNKWEVVGREGKDGIRRMGKRVKMKEEKERKVENKKKRRKHKQRSYKREKGANTKTKSLLSPGFNSTSI